MPCARHAHAHLQPVPLRDVERQTVLRLLHKQPVLLDDDAQILCAALVARSHHLNLLHIIPKNLQLSPCEVDGDLV